MGTRIQVGERVCFELAEDAGKVAGRMWDVFLDGESVGGRGFVDLHVSAPLDDLTFRSAVFRRDLEPPAGLITELRRHGWTVALVGPGEEENPDGLRAVVLDKDGKEVSYRVGAHQSEAAQLLGRQAAHAAFWWHVGDTERQQRKE